MEQINIILLLSFFTLIIILIAMSGDSCHAENNLFDTTKTYLFGSICTNSIMFWVVCLLAILIQIGRNILWIKNSQATREALKENRSKRNLVPLMLYTLASTSLYILSILVILGGNLIVLAAILIGNLLGVLLSMSEQDADKERMTTALKKIQHRWDTLDGADNLTDKQKQEYEELKNIKEWVKSWISDQQTLNNELENASTLRLRI